jgi:ATP phosphoribosyltransferase regulatory subunit
VSKPRGFEKPVGLRDYLPEVVAKLRAVESKVLDCMRRWGYRQIVTPTLEYYDTVGKASATSDDKLYKLLNNRGMTLVLRSDMTAPIARVAASVLKEEPFPIRLSYHANVFRAIEEEGGREIEFFQTGVELIGDPSADADAEVVALAIASLKAAGVRSFKMAIGHVGFLNGLFEEVLPGRQDEQQALKDCLQNRDYVGYRERIRGLALPEPLAQELEGILRLRGGREICEQAGRLGSHPRTRESIAHLCEIWEVLEAYGVCDHVLIDLTMIGDFSYYTGMTFEGYADGLGFPVASGGRYDNLLGQFGRPAPATGFALKTTRILEVIGDGEDRAGGVLVLYEPKRRHEALTYASELRLQGLEVETRRLESPEQTAAAKRLNGRGGEYEREVYREIAVFAD